MRMILKTSSRTSLFLGAIQGVSHDNIQANHLRSASITRTLGFLSPEVTAMSFLTVLAMTAAELFGNTHLKWYTERGHNFHLVFGLSAWALTIFFLIQALRNGTMMWTCIMWEAAIVIGGALTAYFIFGEKFTHWIQWIGILMALGAAVCINYQV
jgi:multidrug transporter EmrE-like cation transporter